MNISRLSLNALRLRRKSTIREVITYIPLKIMVEHNLLRLWVCEKVQQKMQLVNRTALKLRQRFTVADPKYKTYSKL
jgi:hypothetical protein